MENGALRIGLFGFQRLVHGGGFEEYLIALANALTVRGHRVSIVTASPGAYRALGIALNLYYRTPLLSSNVRVSRAEVHERLGPAELFEVAVTRMASLLRRCDVVYAKNELLDLAVLHVLRTTRLPPIVCGVHTPIWYPRSESPQARLHNALYLGRAYRALLSGISAVHVLNSYDATLFPRAFRWPPDRVVRIPHPFSVAANEPRRSPAPGGRLRVLWAGRLTEQKGVDTLIRIIEAINGSAAVEDFTFAIAGSGDSRLEGEIQVAASRYDNVRYLGHVRHEEMAGLYGEADLALVTSNWEALPYSCLEAQSRGVPVIASDIPGCRDIVEHEATGFLFPPGDADAAVETLTAVRRLRDGLPDGLQSLSRHAFARIRERHDPSRVNDALERMLLTVARGDELAAPDAC